MTYKDSVLVCAASVILWHRKERPRRTKDKNIKYPILKYWNLESKKIPMTFFRFQTVQHG